MQKATKKRSKHDAKMNVLKRSIGSFLDRFPIFKDKDIGNFNEGKL